MTSEKAASAPLSDNEQASSPAPRVLAVGGFDPSGAAGVLADIKTLQEIGVFACAATTAVTAQNQHGVSDVMSIPASLVGAQMDAAFKDAAVDVVKTGMLATVDVVYALIDRVQSWGAQTRLVIDPVLRSSSGRSLLDSEGTKLLMERLLPMASLITPNLEEAEELTGRSANSVDEMSLLADHFLAMGANAVLIKGGHLLQRDPELEESTDLLRTADGEEYRIKHERLSGPVCRGTGCTLASAISAYLAEGFTLGSAVQRACDYTHSAIKSSASYRNVRSLNWTGARITPIDQG